MYNIDVLGEVQFWRHYLSRGSSRIILRFGRQSLVVDTDLLATEVDYPRIPDDTDKHMKVMYDDDLLSLADYNEAVEFEDDGALLVEDDEQEGGDYDGGVD